MTLHPQGKNGVRILRRRYDMIREFILDTVRHHGAISFAELNGMAVNQLRDRFDGKVGWYVVTVKLDLEARGELERIPGTSPHQLKIKKR